MSCRRLWSDGRCDGRHIEFLNTNWWNERRVTGIKSLAHVHGNRLADEREIVVANDRGHVPAEVLDRIGDLAVLDEEHAVARHAGVEERLLLRRNAANVPEGRDEQAPARLLDHIFDRQIAAFLYEAHVRRRGLARGEVL